MGVAACRARPVRCLQCGEAPRPAFGNQWGERKACALLGAGRAEPGKGCASLSWLGLAQGPRAPKEGSFYASGVLCRDSLAERDKVRCPSTSPGSLELRELILMGPIQLSLQGN